VVDVATARLVWWILMGVMLCVVVGATSMAYVETLYMKAQLKREMKELRKLKEELKEVPASEILDKVQKGEPVEYDHVVVKGDLNLPGQSLNTFRFDRRFQVLCSLSK
jgi:aminoglycoside phosphotransferase